VCLRPLPPHELMAAEPGNGAVYGDTFVRKATDRTAYEMGRIGDNEYASIQVGRRHRQRVGLVGPLVTEGREGACLGDRIIKHIIISLLSIIPS